MMNPWNCQPEDAPKVEGFLEETCNRITKEDIRHFAEMLQPVPDTKLEQLAKLFRPYMTGAAHDKLVADGKMPFGVILNRDKICDDEFLSLAVYSLNTYFNIPWARTVNPDVDAVHFMFLPDNDFETPIQGRRTLRNVDFYSLFH